MANFDEVSVTFYFQQLRASCAMQSMMNDNRTYSHVDNRHRFGFSAGNVLDCSGRDHRLKPRVGFDSRNE